MARRAPKTRGGRLFHAGAITGVRRAADMLINEFCNSGCVSQKHRAAVSAPRIRADAASSS